MVLARPSVPLTIVRADSVPKSWSTPPMAMSMRSVTPDFGCPAASRTRATIDACDAPSRVSVSGVALSATDVERSDGPDTGGGCVWCTVQAPSASARPRGAAKRAMVAMALLVPEVAELDHHRPGHGDIVAHLVPAVEGDVGDRRDDVGIRDELHERRLFLR